MSEKQFKDDSNEKDNPIKSVVDSTQQMCPICLTAITNRGVVSGCSHQFCFECISQWSTEHNRCPICRSVYSNIRYNIVSNEIFDEIPVEEQPESDDVESLLHRLVLIIRVVILRNRSQRRRDQLLEELNETEQQMERSNVTRRQTKELEQTIQDILSERRRLDEEIRLFNETLTEDASDEQLIEVLNGREGEFNQIEAIDLIIEPGDLFQDLENPFGLLEDHVSDDLSGYESDNEYDSEVEEEEDDSTSKPNDSQHKRNTDSDDSQERSLKRRKRQ